MGEDDMSARVFTTIVPFGKYKGWDVSTMLSDHPYCAWLTEQLWFRKDYKEIYLMVLCADDLPKSTPEKNITGPNF